MCCLLWKTDLLPSEFGFVKVGSWYHWHLERPRFPAPNRPWEGALLERHSHSPHTTGRHQHLSYFVRLHLSEPAPFVWRSQGKQGNKTIESGSIHCGFARHGGLGIVPKTSETHPSESGTEALAAGVP